MAPLYVSTAPHAGNPTTAPSVTLTTTAANDILIATVVSGGSTTVPTFGGTYNGGAWTLIDSGTWTTGAGATYWSRCTGNHSGQTVTATTVDSGSIAVHRITGALTTGSPIGGSTGASVAAANGALSAFTTTDNDSLVCLTIAVDDNQAYSAPTKDGVAMTARTSASSTGGGDSLVGLATADQAVAGTSGAFAITQAAGTAQGKRFTAFAIKPQPVAVIADLVDDFDTNGTPDSTKWPSQGGSPVRAGGLLQTTGSTAGADYTWVQSASAYRATGSETFVKLTSRPSSFNGTVDFFVRKDTSNEWIITIGSGTNPGILFRERVAGTLSDVNIPWVPADMAWLKIAVASDNTVTWHTSPTGQPGSWTQQRSKAAGYTPTDAMHQVLQVQTFGANAGTVEWDNFNVLPIATTPIAGSETFTFSDSSSGANAVAGSESLGLTDTSSVTTDSPPSATYAEATYGTGFYSTGTSLSKAGTDGVTFSDTTAAQLATARSVAEDFTFLDVLARAITDTKQVSEAFSLTDTRSTAVNLSRSDAVTVSEALERAISVSDSEGIVVSDSAILAQANNLNVSETLLWTDVSALSVLLSRVDSLALAEQLILTASQGVTDSFAWADAAVTTSNTFIVGAETHTLSDSAALFMALSLATADSLVLSEAVALNNALAAVDSAVETGLGAVAAALARAESVALSESAAVLSGLNLQVSDALVLNDLASLLATLQLSRLDSWSLSDLAALAVTSSRTDSLAVTDASAVLRGAALEVNDTQTTSEFINLSIALAESDTSTLTELGLIDATNAVAAFDALVLLAEQAVAGPLTARYIHLPTRAVIVAWAARATIAAFKHDAAVETQDANAVLVGNIKGMTLTKPKTSVVLTPSKRGVDLG